MSPGLIVAIIVIVAVAVLAVGYVAWNSKRKSEHLRERFGPEYDRAVSETGKRKEAERELSEREKRVQTLRIKELEPEERNSFSGEWQTVQSRFVDDPKKAIQEADDLCQRVMDARGYPVSDFEQMSADISVDHPNVVRNYRAAHAIAESDEEGQSSTEDLRQAMIHYRALFSELLGEHVGSRS